MKISVNIKSICIVIPCQATNTIQWLIDETLHRASAMNEHVEDVEKETLEAHLEKTKGILMKEDVIGDVLDDNEIVFLAPKGCLGAIKDNEIKDETKLLEIDGNSLTPLDLLACGEGKFQIRLSDSARVNVQKSRDLINEIVASGKVVYGVNTGFGKFANVVIDKEKLMELQVNLIRSHAVGVGEPLSIERTRAMFALRINIVAKGYSGISLENLDKMIAIFNAGCVSFVPCKGTVGASGDLAPLAHLALGLIGEGVMWSQKTGWTNASTVLKTNGLQPIDLGPKEGLAMINGTQFITALGCEALERAASACRQASVIASMSLEALKGTTKALDPAIHKVRAHVGQNLIARHMRSLLNSDLHISEIAASHQTCTRVQDPYTLRCVPQVHGVTHDTIQFVRGLLTVEVNSATDNPMVFADIGETMSGGNFHGEYPAKGLDYLAIAIHEIGSMSERRIERLINPAYSEFPAFLTQDGGLNSGFMMAHCTAASLVSENKVLTHPSSVDSLSTSAGTEDHVSMGGFAARKAIQVVENVEYVLAVELLAVCQAFEFLRPLKSTAPLEAVYQSVRDISGNFNSDRYFKPELDASWKLIREGKLWDIVKPYMDSYENWVSH